MFDWVMPPHGFHRQQVDQVRLMTDQISIVHHWTYWQSILHLYRKDGMVQSLQGTWGNHPYVVKEFSKYVNSGGKSNLLFVGSHLESDYGRFIEKLISSKDLNDRIRIMTDLPQRELYFLYRQALAFIYASSCECCPNILIEISQQGSLSYSRDEGARATTSHSCLNIQTCPWSVFVERAGPGAISA